MDKDCAELLDRAATLGIKETELAKLAGISYPTWWRLKKGRVEKKVTRVLTLQKVRDALDREEQEQQRTKAA